MPRTDAEIAFLKDYDTALWQVPRDAAVGPAKTQNARQLLKAVRATFAAKPEYRGLQSECETILIAHRDRVLFNNPFPQEMIDKVISG